MAPWFYRNADLFAASFFLSNYISPCLTLLWLHCCFFYSSAANTPATIVSLQPRRHSSADQRGCENRITSHKKPWKKEKDLAKVDTSNFLAIEGIKNQKQSHCKRKKLLIISEICRQNSQERMCSFVSQTDSFLFSLFSCVPCGSSLNCHLIEV